MKLKKLVIDKFLSYNHQEIDFNSMSGVVFLIGKIEDDSAKSNGSGKSAVFDSISWCLYGKSRTSDDDELIKNGEKDMSISLEFEIDGKDYSVVRSKKLGKSQTLAFTCLTDGKKLTGNSVKETQSNIIKELGLDDELYENTVFARQGRIDEFPRQLPARRKEMLRDILKLGQYESWEQQAREMARTYEVQYSAVKLMVDRLESEVAVVTVTEQDVDKWEAAIVQVQGKIKLIEDSISKMMVDYNNLRATKQLVDKETDNWNNLGSDVDRMTSQLKYLDDNAQREVNKILKEKEADVEYIKEEEKVRSIIAEIESKIRSAETARTTYESLTQQTSQLEQEIKRIQGMIKEYDSELEKLRKKLATFKDLGDKCPLCMSTINEDQKLVVESDIIAEGKGKRDYRDKLNAELDSATDMLKRLKEEVKKVDQGFGKSRELELDKQKFDKELLDIQTAKSRIEFTDTKVEETRGLFMRQKIELNFELKRKRGELEKSAKLIESYTSQLAGLDKMNAEINGMEEIRKTYMEEEKKSAEELHRIQWELKEYKKKVEELSMTRVKMEKDQSDLFVYSELTKAFGKNGIPLFIIENAIAELQSEVQAQLNLLTDGAISVEFKTQKELKSGKTSDSLDIIVSDRSGSRDFSLYSGGERMRVALAIRLGLSRLLSRRAGKKYEVLIIDEISDLDTSGMSKFVELIGEVSKNYKQVFVVSHISELKDQFNQIITVIKKDGESKIYL